MRRVIIGIGAGDLLRASADIIRYTEVMNMPGETPRSTGRSLASLNVRLGDDGELNMDLPVEEVSNAAEPVIAQPASTYDPNAAFDALFDLESSGSSHDPGEIPTDTPSMLRRAAKLIKDGDRVGAKKIVDGVLSATRQNADAWYLYAYLSENRDLQLEALKRALAISPNHDRARQLLARIRLGNQDQDIFEGILAKTAATVHRPEPKQTDKNALIIGFICAAFFGIFGISHVIKGKAVDAFGYFVLGLLWMAIATAATVSTGFCAGIPLLALHFYLAWAISKRGASTQLAPEYVV